MLGISLSSRGPDSFPNDLVDLGYREVTAPTDIAESRWLASSPHDDFVWARARETSDRLSDLVTEVADRLPTVEPLMADLFAAFYRSHVSWRPQGAPDPAVEVNRAILDRVLASTSYARLHPGVNGLDQDTILVVDAFTRALAAALNPELVDYLGAEASFHADKGRLDEEAEEIGELVKAKAKARKQTSEGPKKPDEMTATERKERLAQISEEIESLEHQHNTSVTTRRVRRELSSHLDAAGLPDHLEQIGDALDEFHGAMSTWGFDDGPEVELSLDERLSLFRHYLADDKLRTATELLGRARHRAAGAHRTLTRSAPVQISGTELGAELHLHPRAIAVFLGDPDLEREFFRRFAEQELTIRTYEYRGEPDRGPVIVLIDESASMAGDRERVSKGIGIALIGIARADRRASSLIEFSSHGQQRVTHFVPGETDMQAVISALTHFFGGGTDFDAPLTTALDLIEADPRYTTADIVVITDAEAPLHPDTLARLTRVKHEGPRLFVVCVGVDDGPFHDVAARTWPYAELVTEPAPGGTLINELVDAIH